MKKIGYLSLSILFALQAFTLSLSLPDLVLCVADDHVQLELQTTPQVCSHNASTSSEVLSLKHAFHSDTCIDVPLFLHNQHVISKKQVLYFNISVAYVSNNLSEAFRTITPLVSHKSPSFVLHQSLRSVVLLI